MANTYNLDDVLMLVASDTTESSQDIVNSENVHEVEPIIQLNHLHDNLDVSRVVEVSASDFATDISVLTQNVEKSNQDDLTGSPESQLLADGGNTTDNPPTDDDNITENSLTEDGITSDIGNTSIETSSRSRKRKRDPISWVKVQRKVKRQSGQSYTSSRGTEVPERRIKTTKDCIGSCKYKCAQKITTIERQKIFQSYWSLTDDGKNHFYNKTVERMEKKRQRTPGQSRRSFSFAFFFNVKENRIRVCKEYYLSTLNISQRRVSYYFEVKHNKEISTPNQTDLRGRATKDRVPLEQKTFVRSHIGSFPKVESHYCRSKTKRQYLEQGLTLNQMYRLYLEECERTSQPSVKENIYRSIFNREFNLAFHKPKKDRCDRCEEFKIKEQFNQVDDDLRITHEQHIASKEATKEERDKDRRSTSAVVCFDLENVISCPRANISSFFYRRKLSVYNLTAHCSLDSSAYCAIWNETQAGRGANEIASALITILERINNMHAPNDLVLWSDSCVAQNRNSGIVFALKDFMSKHLIKSIEQKYCEPGHSSIQEVDSIHSRLENQMSNHEIFSPLGVIKAMKRSWSKAPMHIIQMKESNFKKYMEPAKLLNLKQVPFTKVKSIKFKKDDIYSLEYKTSFADPSTTVSVRPRNQSARLSVHTPLSMSWPTVKTIKKKPELSKEKIADIKAMLKFMTPVDKTFMSGLIS